MIAMVELMTTKQVAAMLGVKTQQVTAWVRRGCPRSKNKKFDPKDVADWLKSEGIASDGSEPPKPDDPFDSYDGQIERTAGDCADAMGVSLRTVNNWLRDSSFPGMAGDKFKRNGFFPIEKIRAWHKAREQKNQTTASGASADPTKQALDQIKLRIQEQKLAELTGQTIDLAAAVSWHAESHAIAKQGLFAVIDEVVAALPADIDPRIKDSVKQRVTVLIENKCIELAESFESKMVQ